MNTLKLAMIAVVVVGTVYQVNAVTINLNASNSDWQGTSNTNPNANDVETITGTSAELTEVYKSNVGGGEEGSFASSYETTYSNTSSDPSDALVEYVSGPVVSGSPIYILAKDGNVAPYWYLWDISGWDGLMDISITGLWPDQGAISHVSIFTGEGGSRVPDGGSTSLLLMGALALLGGLKGRLNK